MPGQSRTVIESVYPEVNGGKYFIKRVVGQRVHVEADIFSDGHDIVQAELLFKHENERKWKLRRFKAMYNDRWQSEFIVEKQGFYNYKIQAWMDHALYWHHSIELKVLDEQNVTVELLDGIQHLEFVLKNAELKSEKDFLRDAIAIFPSADDYSKAVELAKSSRLRDLFIKYPNRKYITEYEKDLQVYVDRKKALFSAWYEFFPRSASSEKNTHGTFKDCERLLPRIAKMGFDVIYFPPIHPIGKINRKGINNTVHAKEGDVGSCWAIGSDEGGHKSIHPKLGTLADFKRVISKAKELDIEIAMDFAIQCAPDHPYVKQHPEWFKWRPDGTVQYAENPPKKYQDILPIYFETEDWESLWDELLSIVLYWVDQGIRVFRVDNPHTKPFRFWEWLIAKVKEREPDVLFLSEAFTKPKVMHKLTKVGFTQSYTYFAWRNYKHELVEYVKELTQSPGSEYFRPNFWPNTPDINPFGLQSHNESFYLSRFFLAATLSSNYGIFGPVFEYMVGDALPGREEYLHSEKYEVRHWDWDKDTKLTNLISSINKIRKENSALHFTNNLVFCHIENDSLLAYYKESEDGENKLLMVVSLDSYNRQIGSVQTPLERIGVEAGEEFVVKDLITDNYYFWNQEWNYIELHPSLPFHLFKIIKQ